MRVTNALSGINAFVQVVDSGSFALAAERLHLTRSAVAKIIARLEERLGTRLFHRTTRTQSLTEDGQAFYERCVRALAELEAGHAALLSGRREPAGLLRVSAPLLFGRHCVAPALLQLSDAHPRLSVDLSLSDTVVDVVTAGYDLAVRVGTLPDSATLASRRLGTQRMLICASPRYLEKRGAPKTIDQLAGHQAIAYCRHGNPLPWRLRDDDGRVRELAIEARLRFDDLQAIADAAAGEHGIAWLPCWLASAYLKRGDLVQVLDCARAASVDVHVIWPQARHLPAKTRSAIDILVKEVPVLLNSSEGSM